MRNLFSVFQARLARPKRLRISTRDRILFAKRLSLYLRAGIPILESLELIRETPGSASHARLLQALTRDVKDGMPLSRSLRSFPRAYASLHVQLIAIGEASGTLPTSLAHLASALEQRAARIRTVLGLLAYPAILLLGSFGVTIFLIAYAFPKIVPLFRGLHVQLPFTTRVLLTASHLLQEHGLLLLFGLLVFICFVVASARSTRIRIRIDPLLIRTPILGSITRSFSLAFIFRTIATLLGSGVRLDLAISMAEEGTQNHAYKAALGDIRENILSGGKLSGALLSKPLLFPTVSLQLMMVGEMTGTLAESATSAANIFEEEITERLRVFGAALEPVLMLVMGLVIGFVALGIISPMYGITQSLSV